MSLQDGLGVGGILGGGPPRPAVRTRPGLSPPQALVVLMARAALLAVVAFVARVRLAGAFVAVVLTRSLKSFTSPRSGGFRRPANPW